MKGKLNNNFRMMVNLDVATVISIDYLMKICIISM